MIAKEWEGGCEDCFFNRNRLLLQFNYQCNDIIIQAGGFKTFKKYNYPVRNEKGTEFLFNCYFIFQYLVFKK